MLKRYMVVLAVVLLLGTAACAKPGATKSPSKSEQKPSENTTPTAEGELGRDNIPSEPGYSWDVAQFPGTTTIPVSLSASGPWTLTADSSWPVTTTSIVDPAGVPGIGDFADYDFVVGTNEFGEQVYYPRKMTAEWMEQLGKITISSGTPVTEQYENPLRLWPLNFKVGDTFVVTEGGSFRIDATVIAQNTAIVPAGTIEDAYLVRYDYTPLTEGAIEGRNYYILAPKVGFVALFGVAAGDEASGFTALDSESVLVRLPEKR